MTDRSADLWSEHAQQWRDPAAVITQWPGAPAVDKRLLEQRASRRFSDLLERLDVTLLVTREYEHLVMALSVHEGRPHTSYLPLPHPSGIAVDEIRREVHVAATRNPNHVFTLAPALVPDGALVPVRSRFLPGSLYIHDLAMVGGVLHGNAVGQNAIVRLNGTGDWERVWWPKAIETDSGPDFARNYIQLNSIAAGPTLEQSYFSASSDVIGAKRPGMRSYPVDGRGVIFSGRTRDVVARGLTRPHSARFEPSTGRLWVDNSGYGEVGVVDDGRFEAVARLPGWTRGLAFRDGTALVATSRVIPRFRAYAPGLDVDRSICGIHALDLGTGEVVGSIRWPYGNQVFAVESASRSMTLGLPFTARRRSNGKGARDLFYGFETENRRTDADGR